jgi:hypothetical protein
MADLPGDLEREEQLEPSRGEAHERARKINPAYTEGELVRVAGARHQAEAELIQGILLEEGVPSVLRRTRGFDVPDFLAAGPRDVLVPASGAVAAHELLASLDMAPEQEQDDEPQLRLALRLTAAVVLVLAVVAAVVWLTLQAGG